MNDQGDHTGAKSSSWAVTTGIMYVAPFQILGARYAAFIRGLGYADLSITTPKQAGAKTYDRIGLIDPEFISMNLSWNLGGHVFVSSELGFVPPIGQYSKTAALNIGQGHWALLPGAAISWLPKNYQMTLQGVLVKNYQNADTHYTNGTTIDFDATAIDGRAPGASGLWAIITNRSPPIPARSNSMPVHRKKSPWVVMFLITPAGSALRES